MVGWGCIVGTLIREIGSLFLCVYFFIAIKFAYQTEK